MTAYGVARLESDSCQRRGFLGVDTSFTGCQKYHGDLSVLDFEYGAQPQIGLGIADPALACVKIVAHYWFVVTDLHFGAFLREASQMALWRAFGRIDPQL